jgi:hypothetical protein
MTAANPSMDVLQNSTPFVSSETFYQSIVNASPK